MDEQTQTINPIRIKQDALRDAEHVAECIRRSLYGGCPVSILAVGVNPVPLEWDDLMRAANRLPDNCPEKHALFKYMELTSYGRVCVYTAYADALRYAKDAAIRETKTEVPIKKEIEATQESMKKILAMGGTNDTAKI